MHPHSPITYADDSSHRSVTHTQEPDHIDRRTFARGILGVVSASVVVSPLAAQPDVAGEELGTKPIDLSTAEWDEVQARFNNLLRVYGERLSPEQRHTLGNVLIGNERMLSSIRKFAIQNTDPAALTLRLVHRQTLS